MANIFDLIRKAGGALLGTGDGKLLEKGAEVLDTFIYSKEERAEHEAEMERRDREYEFRLKELEQDSIDKTMQYDLGIIELEVKDKDSARQRESQIAAAAPSKLWGFTVNITAIIAISIVLMFFSLDLFWAMGFFENEPNTKTWEMLTVMAASYYLGSSFGSFQKDLRNNRQGK